jgi:NodT family efflux transporter outer membrane factor (OMF) lipoprotein
MQLKPITRLLSLATTWLAVLLGGCAASRINERPTVEVPPSFKEASAFRAAPLNTPVADEWWRAFNEPALDELQTQLVAENQNLRIAVAQYRAAQAALAASRSSLFPVIGLGISGTRSSFPPTQQMEKVVSLSGSASWELDLWGRLSSQVDSAKARLEASQADLAAAQLSLQSLLAQTYFSLRAEEAQIALLDRSVTAYARSLQLTQSRYEGGVVSAADVAQAQTQLKNTEAQRVEARSNRAQLEHAIAVLVGKPPAVFNLSASSKLPSLPPVPQQLPSQLLQRRPDIAAAAFRVAAAQSQVGAARAAFFPAVSLSASTGFRADGLAGIISAPNRFWSIGPALALAAFDGGARQAAVDTAIAATDQATASYRQTVLTAFQEVEDNLVLATSLQEQAALLQESLVAAQRSVEIANDQYKGGTISYLSVVTAQTSALAAERSLLEARTRSLVATNQLLKNIAGRWE